MTDARDELVDVIAEDICQYHDAHPCGSCREYTELVLAAFVSRYGEPEFEGGGRRVRSLRRLVFPWQEVQP